MNRITRASIAFILFACQFSLAAPFILNKPEVIESAKYIFSSMSDILVIIVAIVACIFPK